MTIFVSIISHGHEDMLSSTSLLDEISKVATVIIKNNRQLSKGKLTKLRLNKNIIIIDDGDYGLGFGHNNNYVFKYISDKIGIDRDDYFCVINPDIIVDGTTILDLVSIMQRDNHQLCTIPLYLDKNKTLRDESIRNFPVFIDFLKSFFLGKRNAVTLRTISDGISSADWAAGSFLIFTAPLFWKLKGFNQRYFMYCEDIDICYRAKSNGIQLVCLTDYYAIHLAQRASRSFFSKNFVWHIKSIFIYLFLKNKKTISII